ncbi:hypothetical protein LN050_02715 [Comamonadaceae bacterium M7527]|nr:hypothetical protein LN050_02715 [Comamonadaceae bacterium M7527]
MSKEKIQTDYASTLLKYNPGKGWSPIDYTSTDDDTAAVTQQPTAAKVIPMPVQAAASPASVDDSDTADNIANSAGSANSAERAQLDSWLEQAARSPDHFGVHDMAHASLETLSQRLPELFAPLDQYAEEAGELSWDDVANRIADLQETMQARERLLVQLAQTDAHLTQTKRELYAQLHDIQRQERTKAAAAQLRERMSAHTAQEVTKRLRELLAQ